MLRRRNEIEENCCRAQFTPTNDRISEHPRREHCSANGNQIRTLGLNPGQQVRIERPTANGTRRRALVKKINAHRSLKKQSAILYAGLQQKPEDLRDRLGLSTIGSFKGKINAQVTAEGLNDEEAEVYSEFIEHLADNDYNNGLIIIAPHGGNIEKHTDEQAEYVYENLVASKRVSTWICKGFNKTEDGEAYT